MTYRSIKALHLPLDKANHLEQKAPEFLNIKPDCLKVDESYQRDLSRRSISLIARIVRNWDWAAFKPPVVVRVGEELHVLDGQHTAIAAATHPQVTEIPVMIVSAVTTEDRAEAFVKHNRDRLNVSPLQLHAALVVAGDDNACTIQNVCERAGVKILKYPPQDGRYKESDTMAIATLKRLVSRRYAIGARKVLDVCVAAKLTPIKSDDIRAVEELLFSPHYSNDVNPEALAITIRRIGSVAEREAKQLAAAKGFSMWQGLVSVWFQGLPKSRKGIRNAG